MQLKWFGALFVVIGCSGVGWRMAAAVSKEIKILEQLQRILTDLTCSLRFRQAMLPQLFYEIALREKGPVALVFRILAENLSQKEQPQAYLCMKDAVNRVEDLQQPVKEILLELGNSLGSYDLEGQLQQINNVSQHTQLLLTGLRGHKEARTRCCQTLGICTGVIVAILMI